MIILKEEYIKVLDREYLYQLIDDCEDINEFTADLLFEFVDNICTELSELGFQMNRQPMNLYIHKEYSNLKVSFVKLMEDLIVVDLDSAFERDKLLQGFQGNTETYIDNLVAHTTGDVVNQVEKCRERINACIANFISNSNGLVDIENENNNDNKTKLTIGETDDIYKPKHFSMKGSKSFEMPKEHTKKKFVKIDRY